MTRSTRFAIEPLTDGINDALHQAGLTKAADIRVGHFEASSQVPAGGIDCGIPVQKTVDKDPVTVGDNFTYTIKVDNPYDCTLTDVKVTDTISGSEGVLWTVTGTDPKADTQTNDKLVWNDIGPIKPGDSAEVHISVTVPENSAGGRFTDHATATATCGSGSTSGGTSFGNGATLTGTDTLTGPDLNGGGPGGGGQKEPLADTGMSAMLGLGAALVLLIGLAVLAIRRYPTAPASRAARMRSR